jgi:hypothetical protein
VLAHDPKAKRVLFDSFWSAQGWRKQTPEPQAFEYARSKGYMFPPAPVAHDWLVKEITEFGQSLAIKDVSDAFLASLTTRRLDLRPALSSLAIARHFPVHSYSPREPQTGCAVCGGRREGTEDLNVLNFERHKWGGVRLLDPVFIWFSLDRFKAEGGAEPTDADRELLLAVVDAISSLPEQATATKAEAALRAIKSSKEERFAVLDMLGTCGILAPPDHPGFATGFVQDRDRSLPAQRFIDRKYPVVWWHGRDGVDQAALRLFFPQLEAR